MFCPKCGIETVEGHKFCKSCGANLQLVSDALKGGDDTLGQLRVDFDALKRSLGDVAKKIKVDLGIGTNAGAKRQAGDEWWSSSGNETNTAKHSTHSLTEREVKHPKRASFKPKEWLQYSWQHNVRDGLISLFGGAGLGAFLYYMGREAINSGVIEHLEGLWQVRGIEPLVRLIWLVSLIPILKGLAHLAYAAFFGESIASLSERFLPAQISQISNDAATSSATSSPRTFSAQTYPVETPGSVTEQTTNILEKDESIADRGLRIAD